MRYTRRLTLLPAFLLMVVCAYGQDVHYNYDRGTNFASYKTYQWVDITGGAVADQLIDRDIKRAVDEQLAQKGLTRVEKCADLYVGYQATVKQKSSLNMDTRFARWWNADIVEGETSTIRIGILLVNLYDPRTKHLIWRGDASKTIDLNKDPDKNYKNLQKPMAKLFRNYPPQPNN